MIQIQYHNINFRVRSYGVLLVEETRVPGENHRPVASHRQT
jgi:sortase (surface protein transpeptidase)